MSWTQLLLWAMAIDIVNVLVNSWVYGCIVMEQDTLSTVFAVQVWHRFGNHTTNYTITKAMWSPNKSISDTLCVRTHARI